MPLLVADDVGKAIWRVSASACGSALIIREWVAAQKMPGYSRTIGYRSNAPEPIMKNAAPAQRRRTAEVARITAVYDMPIYIGIDAGDASVVDAWDTASVRRLKKLVTAFRLLAKSGPNARCASAPTT